MATYTAKLADSPVAPELIRAGFLSVADCAEFEAELARTQADLEGKCPLDSERLRSADAVRAYGAWLYVLVRLLEPEVVVETGVQNGCSTELLLWALHRNRRGRLFSIDSGSTSTDGSHKSQWHATRDGVPGRDILPGLRERWELIIGTSQDELPGLCARLGEVDIFWHDSDHSHENVRFEFETVAPYVRPGGLLCMHDYHGQDTGLGDEEYELVAPQKEPILRVWRKGRRRGGRE